MFAVAALAGTAAGVFGAIIDAGLADLWKRVGACYLLPLLTCNSPTLQRSTSASSARSFAGALPGACRATPVKIALHSYKRV
jgi:hypothetical protein